MSAVPVKARKGVGSPEAVVTGHFEWVLGTELGSSASIWS